MLKFFAGVLSDPHDQQGSTKRLCLFLFLTTIMALIVWATVTGKAGQLPTVPDSILNLVYFVVGALTTGLVADKGIAAYKVINTSTESTPSIALVQGPAGPAGLQGPAGPQGPAGVAQ